MKKIILLALLPTLIFGQGILIKEGTHSITASYSHLTNKTSSANGFGLVFSYSGLFDIGLSYSTSNTGEADLKSTSFSPTFAFNFRVDSGLGGVRISMGYLSSKISSRYSPTSVKVDGFLVNGTLALPIIDDESLALIPAFGVTYGFLSSTGGNTETSRNVDMQLLIKVHANEIALVFGPGVSINLNNVVDDSFSYGASLAVLFNFGTQ